MFLEMFLATIALLALSLGLVYAGVGLCQILELTGAGKNAGVFAVGLAQFLSYIGIPTSFGAPYGSVFLSYSKKKQQKDPLLEYLLRFIERMEHTKTLLTDASKTAFFFVTLPEALPIAVIKRFINWFQDFGIPVGGVVVNDKDSLGEDVSGFRA